MYSSRIREQNIKISLMGLKCVSSPNNQPSLTYSVLTLLKNLAEDESSSADFLHFLHSMGIDSTGNDESALRNVQNLLSKEMVGENESLYEEFLLLNKNSNTRNDSSTLSLIKSEVDIAMLHAAANVFKVPFIIIPSCPEAPFLPVLPKHVVYTCAPCFILFDSDTGVFSALTKTEIVANPTSKKSCSCGYKRKKISKKTGSKFLYVQSMSLPLCR